MTPVTTAAVLHCLIFWNGQVTVSDPDWQKLQGCEKTYVTASLCQAALKDIEAIPKPNWSVAAGCS